MAVVQNFLSFYSIFDNAQLITSENYMLFKHLRVPNLKIWLLLKENKLIKIKKLKAYLNHGIRRLFILVFCIRR